MRGLLILSTCMHLTLTVVGQEMLGIINSGRAGINHNLVNPAKMHDSQVYSDFNLITLGVFIDNDWFYQTNYSLIYNDPVLTSESKYHTEREYVNAHQNFIFRGPSAMWRMKGVTVGVHFDVRQAFSANHIHQSLATIADKGFDYYDIQYEDYKVRNSRINLLAWSEIGFSLAKNVYKGKYSKINIGGTARFLMGHAFVYANMPIMDYRVEPDPTVLGHHNMHIDRIKVNYWYSQGDADKFSIMNGNGLGVNLGFTYERDRLHKRRLKIGRNKRSSYHFYSPYRWQFGSSLQDFGGVFFFGSRTRTFKFDSEDDVTWESIDHTSVNDVADFNTTSSEEILEDEEESAAAKSKYFGLPMAISSHLDYNIWQFVFVQANWVKSIPNFGPGVDRPDLIAISPRFEHPIFEITTPLMIYNYRKVRGGLAIRLKTFTIGTDRLGAFVNKRGDFSGADFYLSWKLSRGYWDDIMDKKGGAKPNAKKKKTKPSVPCMKF